MPCMVDIISHENKNKMKRKQDMQAELVKLQTSTFVLRITLAIILAYALGMVTMMLLCITFFEKIIAQ